MNLINSRVVMHVDFNSYFASVEQQDNPEWREKPLGVCEHLGGIIIAASVEAKRWGIKTGTPVWEAQKLYPKIILTKTHPDRYRYYTKRFVDVLEEYTDKVELYSIDEAFLDITKFCNIEVPRDGKWIKINPFEEAENIARDIKERIKNEVGDSLRVSIGIGWNKLTAKIASDKQKPNGLVVFKPEEKERLLEEIKLIDIPGIGFRQNRNLHNLGITSLKELNQYPKENLITRFGIMGLHLWHMGQLENSFKEQIDSFKQEQASPGLLETLERENPHRVFPSKVKSMGHMYTLPRAVRKKELLFPTLSKLCEMVASRLRAAGLEGEVISTYVNGLEEISAGGSHRLGYATQDPKEIFMEARKLLLGMLNGIQVTPVLIAITVASLKKSANQKMLFPKFEKRKNMLTSLDKIQTKHGQSIITSLRSFQARHAIRDSVGFGRVKELNNSRHFPSLGRFK